MRTAITRRSFLGTGAAIAGALAVSRIALAGPAEAGDAVAQLGPTQDLNGSEPTLVNAQFKDADDKIVAEKKVFVRYEAGTKSWVVISAICTHLKCKVDYKSDEGIFRCPCHKSEFELNGKVIRKPAKKPLPDYSEFAYVENDCVMLRQPGR